MQAVFKGFSRLGPSLPAELWRKRREPRATRREVRRVTASQISHNLAGPATAILGNLELARTALDSLDTDAATELVDAALVSARELSERLSSIQQDFEVEGVDR